MATTLRVNRKTEKINVKDEDGNVVLEWSIPTDDKNLQAMLQRVGNAFDRAQSLTKQIDSDDENAVAEATEKLTRLFGRTISAIVGHDGYEELLEYLGDGEPIDPRDYILDLSDIFAALVSWLYERCTVKQLRNIGIKVQNEQRANGGRIVPFTPKKKKKK